MSLVIAHITWMSYLVEAESRDIVRLNKLSLKICIFLSVLSGPASSFAVSDDANLLDAAQGNDVTLAIALIEEGADVNMAYPDGATALHWAAHWSATNLAEALLRAGAFVDGSNELGITPISIACRNGSEEMVDTLLKADANARGAEPSGETVLMSCARTGLLGAVEKLLASGAEPNSVEINSGQTALMWAALKGHGEVVDALIKEKAEVNVKRILQLT